MTALIILFGLLISLSFAAVLYAMFGPKKQARILCPDCRERVKVDARVCKHCGRRLVSAG